MKARHQSAWTFRQKVGRALWYIIQATLFRCSFRTMYRFRAWLLRCCGADVHPTARIRGSVVIEVPWNLTVGPDVIVGDQVILYCLAPITLKARSMVSQYAHLCAGSHDHTRPDMPLTTSPIVIEEDVWIATDAFVGPGVTVGRGTVLGGRASAFRDLPPWKICVGNPAKPIADREYLE